MTRARQEIFACVAIGMMGILPFGCGGEGKKVTQPIAPKIQIISPADGSIYRQELDEVVLEGKAIDEDGAPMDIVQKEWISNLEGRIGYLYVGRWFPKVAGSHVITYKTTDASGGSMEAQVHIEVMQTCRDFAIEEPLNFDNLEWSEKLDQVLFISSDHHVKALDPASGLVTTILDYLETERLIWAAGTILVADAEDRLYTLDGDPIPTIREGTVLGFLDDGTLLGALSSTKETVRFISLNNDSIDKVVDFFGNVTFRCWWIYEKTLRWHKATSQLAFAAAWAPEAPDVQFDDVFTFLGFDPGSLAVEKTQQFDGGWIVKNLVWLGHGEKILYDRASVDNLGFSGTMMNAAPIFHQYRSKVAGSPSGEEVVRFHTDEAGTYVRILHL